MKLWKQIILTNFTSKSSCQVNKIHCDSATKEELDKFGNFAINQAGEDQFYIVTEVRRRKV